MGSFCSSHRYSTCMGCGSGCLPNEPFVMLNRYKGPLCSLCISVWTTVRCVTSGCNVRVRPIPVHSARGKVRPLGAHYQSNSSQPPGDFSLVAMQEVGRSAVDQQVDTKAWACLPDGHLVYSITLCSCSKINDSLCQEGGVLMIRVCRS